MIKHRNALVVATAAALVRFASLVGVPGELVAGVELRAYGVVGAYEATGGAADAALFDIRHLFHAAANLPYGVRQGNGTRRFDNAPLIDARFDRLYGTGRSTPAAPGALVVIPVNDVGKIVYAKLMVDIEPSS